MRYVYLVGRILFSLIFITAAPRHFTHEGIQHAADLGVAFASLLVPISGVMALAGGLSIAAGYKAR
jgi:putative oxidoreductase